MAAVRLRFRAELRSRWRAWLGLALIVGLVGGVVLALVAGARRTDSAYQRFLRAQNAYDVLVPSTMYGVRVGDEIPILEEMFLGEPPPEIDPEEARIYLEARERILAEIPDNSLTIVGIEASPGEFPPQVEGTGRYLIHASPALFPLRRALGTFSEATDVVMVRLERGQADVERFLARLERLDPSGDESSLVVQRDLSAPVDRSLRTQAVALYLLALLTAVVGALICGQLVARLTLLESSEHAVLSALGLDGWERFGLGMLRSAAIGATGSAVALVLAAGLSPFFPVGLARTAEPDPGFDLDVVALGLGALVVCALFVALAVWPVWRASQVARGVEAARTRASVTGRILTERGAPLPVSTGVRMALDSGGGRSSVPVRSSLIAVTLGVATLVAAVTFGASLAHLLGTPRLYGQSWDVELTTYDDTLATDGAAVLDDQRIEATAVGDFRVGFEIDGRLVDGLVFSRGQGELSPPILEGRPPRDADEVALGTRTMRALGVDVGDSVDVGVYTVDRAPVSMRVVGRSVFPLFGISGQLGDGALMSLAGAKHVSDDLGDPFDTSVLVRLAPGTDVEELVGDVGDRLGTSVFLIAQGRPTDIVSFGRVEATPYILGAILAALSLATLTHLLMSATSRKRRDLAVLKTLGFVRAQVRATIGWQATTLIVIALCAGIPLGVAAGRWIWTLFADELGVVNEPRVPLLAVLVLVPVAVAVANVVAAIPAAVAASTRPATVLRAE